MSKYILIEVNYNKRFMDKHNFDQQFNFEQFENDCTLQRSKQDAVIKKLSSLHFVQAVHVTNSLASKNFLLVG